MSIELAYGNIFGAIILKSVSKVYQTFHHIHKGIFHEAFANVAEAQLEAMPALLAYVGNLTSLKFMINILVYYHIIFIALVAVK